MLFEKDLDRQCDECGEAMEMIRDYGGRGQALQCTSCGFLVEEIDVNGPRLTNL